MQWRQTKPTLGEVFLMKWGRAGSGSARHLPSDECMTHTGCMIENFNAAKGVANNEPKKTSGGNKKNPSHQDLVGYHMQVVDEADTRSRLKFVSWAEHHQQAAAVHGLPSASNVKAQQQTAIRTKINYQGLRGLLGSTRY